MAWLCLIIALLLTLCSSLNTANTPPNILFIMADDLGWNDVSWHDPNIHSPTLEHLAHNNAALLHRAYVNKLCSVTRSAFMAGNYAFRMGTQDDVFQCLEPAGVPLEFKFFPQLLQEAGYSTYLIGKWHLGYCKKEFLPTSRGFDYFRGYYSGREEYFNHTNDFRGCKGLDFWDQLEPRWDNYGKYSTELYTEYVKDYLSKHNRSQPFFLYLAYQAVHEPLEVPDEYLVPCKQHNKDRKTYCGMIHAMDNSISEVVQFLKDKGYYENTVIFFSTDNGGDTKVGGNNYPLRGNKGTLWEGGTRAISFVHSPKYITHTGRRNQLFSVVDWFPTILTIAGLEGYDKYGDGINQWPMISTGVAHQNRTNHVYSIFPAGSAIRRGRYKLIIGDPAGAWGPSGWVPPPPALITGTKLENGGLLLFDLDSDPMERVNLVSQKRISLITSMMREIGDLMEVMHASIHKAIDPKGDPKNFNGTFATGFC